MGANIKVGTIEMSSKLLANTAFRKPHREKRVEVSKTTANVTV